MTQTRSEKSKLDVLAEVRSAMRFRDQEIERSKRIIEDEIPAAIEMFRRQSRDVHRDANRSLVKSIRAAQASGIPIKDIFDAIGLQRQTLFRLENTIRKWDAEEREEKRAA